MIAGIGTVVGFRFPVVFSGTNIFKSNTGGGVSINRATLTCDGDMLFQDNFGAFIGGGLRIGEFNLVSIASSKSSDACMLAFCLFRFILCLAQT